MRGLSPLAPLLLLAAAAPYALAATGAPRERVLAAETSRGADASGGSALSGGGGALRAEPVSGDGGVALGALGAEPLSVASLPSVGSLQRRSPSGPDRVPVDHPQGLGSGYEGHISPSPYPPPPPTPSNAPPSPPPEIMGTQVGLRIARTGNVRVDARNIALIDALINIERIWIPIASAALAIVLFVIHNAASASVERSTYFSEQTRRTVNVIATSTCFILCGFAFIVFNKLVLLSVPLPCLVATLQMGATCIMLLGVNGAVSAVLHSRTKRVIGSIGAEIGACCAVSLPCCACCLPEAADDTDEPGTADAEAAAGTAGGGNASLSRTTSSFGEDAGGGAAAPLPAGSSLKRGSSSFGGAIASEGGSSKRTPICHPSHACCGLTCFGKRRWVGIKVGSLTDVWRWMPASFLYAGAHIFMMMALRDVTVTALIIWRQLAPLPTMAVESLLTNAVYRATCSSATGLIAIIVGVLLYSISDYQFSWLGTLFTLLSTFMMVWEGLLKRHLLTDTQRPLVLSLQAMVLINNAVGCALAMLLVLSYELWIFGYEELPHISTDEICYIAASVFLSALYHYMGLQLAKAVSATSLLAGTNTCKVAVVVFGAVCLGDTATPLAWAGIALAVLGNVIYMLARLHVMQAQALISHVSDDAVDKHEAGDIVDTIAEKPATQTDAMFAGSGLATATWLKQSTSFLGGGLGGGAAGGTEGGADAADGEQRATDPFEEGGGASDSIGCLPGAEVGTRERLSSLRQRVMGDGAADSRVPDAHGYTYSDLDSDSVPRTESGGTRASTAP